jgi:H(+)-translocating pyrophosphatase
MRCYNDALVLCFNGGLFGAIVNVALAIFGITSLFLGIYFVMYLSGDSNLELPYDKIPLLLVGFGFGASFVAMFAQLGGGIYTKAADVGADLIGKIEMELAEDDERNPAVIADLVGDNVGDCAGQAADLFESISAEILSAMILGCSLSDKVYTQYSSDAKVGFILFPLIIHCLDITVSIIGAKFVKTRPGLPMGGSDYQSIEDPLAVMKKGYKVSVTLGFLGIIVLSYILLNVPSVSDSSDGSNYSWLYFAACACIGLIDSYLFIIITQIYTDYNYPSVKSIAMASQTGHATNIISGLSVGLESTAIPVLLISFSLISSYNLGQQANIVDEHYSYLGGLYGTAVATMGMFVSGVFILAMSGFGPIADNAGGIIEMSLSDESVRIITDRLDAVGNITKANTKGYSVGTASLACFLLFSAFMDEITLIENKEFHTVDIAQVEVFIAGILGSGVVFLFSSLALSAVGIAAQAVIKEVKHQIRNDEGILRRTSKPNYKQCVAIVTEAGLKQMILPGLLAVLSPVVVGIFFKYLGHLRKKPMLGPQCVASFLMFSTATGILMALFFNNAGGAWDNAKKYIETGCLGGKHSDTHKAAVTGDTVGDPCKDTAGPSIHILIKLVSTISLVLAPIFV